MTRYSGDIKESLSEIINDAWSVDAKIKMCGDVKTQVVYLSGLCTIMVASCKKWLRNFKYFPNGARDFYMEVFEKVLKYTNVGYTPNLKNEVLYVYWGEPCQNKESTPGP